MRQKFWLILVLCGLFWLTACARNPVSGNYSLNFYSEADEIKMGEEYHQQITRLYGEYADPLLKNYIQDIVSRLGDVSHRPNLDYPVTVLDTPEINAFAIPGGHVYVCRGLLAYLNSEAELAGVLGHEIGHVTARHSVQQMSQEQLLNVGLLLGSLFLYQDDPQKANDFLNIGKGLGGLVGLSYSREDEMAADRLGIEYAYKAGFSPLGVGRVMTMFERLSGAADPASTILATHPASSTRVKQARIEVRKLENAQSVEQDLRREPYLDKIKNLITGHNPEKGIIQDNVFYNTLYLLKFTGGSGRLALDSGHLLGWQTDRASAYIDLLEMRNNPEKTQTTLLEKKLGAAAHTNTNLTWNGSRGNAHVYSVKASDGNYQVIQYFNIYRGKMLVLTLSERISGSQTTLTNINQLLASLQILTTAEAAKYSPQRLPIYTVQKDDTWDSLSQKYLAGAEAQKLAWYNGCELSDPLPERVKLGLF